MFASPASSAESAGPPLDPEVFDDEQAIGQSGRLAELLRLWNTLVRGEIGSVQSFVAYDHQAAVQQRWHQWLVGTAAVTGSAAVLLAILQLASFARPELFGSLIKFFEFGEYIAAVLALVAVVLGLVVAFHTRWQLLRMKTEQYRFVKFHYLLHAGGWVSNSEHERSEHLLTLLAGIHALDSHDAHEWSLGVFSLVDDDPAVIASADASLAEDIVRYFREKRIGSQRTYFTGQAQKRRASERKTWMIPPVCFFLSIVCALAHFSIEIFSQPPDQEHTDSAGSMEKQEQPQVHPPNALMLACLIGAATFPVVGAMVRTMRTAFEFGRNANRFEGVARILASVDQQLQATTTPAVKLELLREAEFVLQHENRSWMRLMIEAEWFG
ncbi:MAG TPA: hypothetical protein VFV87_13425 [Pirellulaceae bacterium]|nr:hypothetical protein [Pirellulaceae bacterium]